MHSPLPATRRARAAPPASSAVGADPPSFASLLMLTLALFALALPIIGPLDDHHFAERTHTHQHIYPAGRPTAHQHSYENPQRHLHSPTRIGNAPTGRDTVLLTSATAGLLLALLSAPCHAPPPPPRPPLPRAADGNRRQQFASAPGIVPDGISIAPPQRPPIA